HLLGRFSASRLWFGLSAVGTFQVNKNFFGAIEHFFGQTGEARYLDPVTLIGTARDDFTEKNDLLVPFAHCDIQIADAFAVLGELGELVIMRGKKSARFDLIVKKLSHTPRNRKSVEGGCSATDLVKND